MGSETQIKTIAGIRIKKQQQEQQINKKESRDVMHNRNVHESWNIYHSRPEILQNVSVI